MTEATATRKHDGTWSVFSSGGACIIEDVTFELAADYMTADRFARGWNMVSCVNITTMEQLDSLAKLATPPVVADLIEMMPKEQSREGWKLSYPEGMTLQQAANELSDYAFMLEQVPKVYMHVTGGRLSKTNYYASSVIGEADDVRNDEIEEAVKEALEEHRDAALSLHQPDTKEQQHDR